MEGYRLIRSGRKTIGLEIRNGELVVRAPWFATQREIEQALAKKQGWIRAHLEESRRKEAAAEAVRPLSREELRELAEKACQWIPGRAAHYAALMGVSYRRITIRAQKTRWGSCSAQGNLNFNCLLMLTPPEVIDSVVVHELCHLKEMNHSERFYREVYRVFPEYDRCHGWLKAHSRELLARIGC